MSRACAPVPAVFSEEEGPDPVPNLSDAGPATDDEGPPIPSCPLAGQSR